MPLSKLTRSQEQTLEQAAIAAHDAFQAYWQSWSSDHDQPFTRAAWEEITPYMQESWRTAAAAALLAAQGPIYRHVVRGTLYEVLGIAEAQVSKGGVIRADNGVTYTMREIKDGTELVVYRGEGGKLWCRFPDEFSDGRFVPVVV